MSEERASPATQSEDSSSITLLGTIRSCREYMNHVITTGRAHSPFSDEKLEAADDAVAEVVHSGYQGVKNILVNGHPGVILPAVAIAAVLPSIPFGGRAIARNSGLAVLLASVLIYPDHLKPYFTGSTIDKKD